MVRTMAKVAMVLAMVLPMVVSANTRCITSGPVETCTTRNDDGTRTVTRCVTSGSVVNCTTR